MHFQGQAIGKGIRMAGEALRTFGGGAAAGRVQVVDNQQNR